ncbi:hypothetical protein [Magnetococcus sp. PR-3]|uniref:hypothetical protein n=1 Tax=Magnetococcus sp. PR-3 TaxID=3120355 RepID=UPI002FCE6824
MLHLRLLLVFVALLFPLYAHSGDMAKKLQQALLSQPGLELFPFQVQQVKGRKVRVEVLDQNRWGAMLGAKASQQQAVQMAYRQQRQVLANAVRQQQGSDTQVLFRALHSGQNAQIFTRVYDQKRQGRAGAGVTVQAIFRHTDPRIMAALPFTVKLKSGTATLTVLNPEHSPRPRLAQKVLDHNHFQKALVQLPGIKSVRIQQSSQPYRARFQSMLGQIRKQGGLQQVEQSLKAVIQKS